MKGVCVQVSNGDLAEAVAFLTEKNAKVPQQDEATYYQTAQITNDRYISVGSQADTSTYLNLRTMIGRNPGKDYAALWWSTMKCHEAKESWVKNHL